jgi:hypothetical protein
VRAGAGGRPRGGVAMGAGWMGAATIGHCLIGLASSRTSWCSSTLGIVLPCVLRHDGAH